MWNSDDGESTDVLKRYLVEEQTTPLIFGEGTSQVRTYECSPSNKYSVFALIEQREEGASSAFLK